MAWLREVWAALTTNLRSVVTRPRHTLLIGFGFLVAGTMLVVLLTIPAGLQRVAGQTGLPHIAMVLSSGAHTESASSIATEKAALIAALPGVAHTSDGRPLVAPQFVVNTRLVRRDGSTATALLRGVTPTFWMVIDHSIRLDKGVRFHAGKHELIAGVAAARGFVSLAIGNAVRLQNQPWRVTGHFTAGGGFWESQLWTDMATLQSVYHAQGHVNVLWVRLRSEAAFNAFNEALHDNPRTQGLYAVTQQAYYASQTGFLRSFIRIVAIAVALALGLGAVLAIANALDMAMAARRRDMAVLRALGFRRAALATALVAEVLLIGLVCAAIAVGIGWFAVNGHEVGSSTLNHAIRFKLQVDVGVIAWTVAYLLVIGLLSAVWSTVRAVQSPLTRTLQNE